MNIAADRLPEQLLRGLAALYVVTGDEPLAAQEAADAIRTAARAAGHTERTVHTVQGKYNWQGLFASGDTLSLFAERRLTEIRIPSGKPGVDGAKALETYAGKLPPDTLTLISLPGVDWKTQQSRWFAALAKAGVVVEARPVERAALPGWIERRLAKQGLTAERDALACLADQVEGNLLAAQQEIDKLALLLPPGKVTRADVERAVVDVSRLEADAVLQLTRDERSKNILSLSGAGRVTEYRLGLLVSYSVVGRDARVLAETETIELARDLTYDDSQLLAKGAEETLLYRDMDENAAMRILRRLQALRSVNGAP